MSTATTNAELMRLRQHITWLHGALSRLGDMQVLASTIDPARELTARRDYARAALSHSLRRCVEAGVADRPPSLAALVVGLALDTPPQEPALPIVPPLPPAVPGTVFAWCDEAGRIGVSPGDVPDNECPLAEGQAAVLWHWIEELAVRGIGTHGPVWLVPGFCPAASISARSDAARRFAHALDQAARGARSLLAPPPEEMA